MANEHQPPRKRSHALPRPPGDLSLNQQEILDWIVAKMLETFDVRRIILFGSQARGDGNPESDYDLIVEVNNQISFRERQIRGLAALHRRPFSVDLMVLTPEEVTEQANFLGSAVDWALQEGKTLYAR